MFARRLRFEPRVEVVSVKLVGGVALGLLIRRDFLVVVRPVVGFFVRTAERNEKVNPGVEFVLFFL